MIHFFGTADHIVYAVQSEGKLTDEAIKKLEWLLANKPLPPGENITPDNADFFVGPRATMITPWSTNAVEITQNMNITGILRIEEFQNIKTLKGDFDEMLSQKFPHVDDKIFDIHIKPEPIIAIDEIGRASCRERV